MLARLKEAVVANWGTKLTALALSTLLWVVVAADQPATQLVAVTLDVTPPDGRALTQALPAVKALLVAPTRELVKLYATPPVIHRIVPDSVSSTRYGLELSPADVSLSGAGDAKVQDVQPHFITLTLSDVARRSVPVTSKASSPADTGLGVASMSERVLMGIPVTFRGEHSGWESEPPAVIVTVRGPVARLQRLTRDSIVVIAVPLGRGASETVRLDVVAPAGIGAAVTPDTAVVQRRPRG